jgi:uncharacterized RDD family membrane protein YckC
VDPIGGMGPGSDGRFYRSPEQVALELPIAGPMTRMLAFMIDYMIVGVVELVVIVALLFGLVAAAELGEQLQTFAEEYVDIETGEPIGGWPYVMMAGFMLIDFVLQWTYFVFFEQLMQGRSPGKAVMGLRVVRRGGLPIDLRASLLRNLLRVVDMLPTYYLIGLTSLFVSKRTQRLGDFAADTIVVREDRPTAALPITRMARRPGADAFRFNRAQLSLIGAGEKRLIRQTLRRAATLDPERAEGALLRAVGVLCHRIDYPEPVAPPQREAFLVALLRAAEVSG